MAWTVVLGSSEDGTNGDEIWEYDNAATASDTYLEANGSYASGIRTFTTPGPSPNETTYVKCRKKDETSGGSLNTGLRGELSKNYFDARRP